MVLEEIIQGLGLDKICVTEKDDSSIKVTYSGAAVLKSLSRVLAYGESALDAMETLFEEDEQACELAKMVFDNLVSINADHYLINGYVISKNVK